MNGRSGTRPSGGKSAWSRNPREPLSSGETMRFLPILLLVMLGCDDEEGIWISESCMEHESTIRETVDVFNEREPDDTISLEEELRDSKPMLSGRRMNDDTDFVYCHDRAPEGDKTRGGRTGIGYGDIHLYPISWSVDGMLGCVLCHELGHKALGLRDNSDPDTLMYGGLFTVEMIPGCMGLPWE